MWQCFCSNIICWLFNRWHENIAIADRDGERHGDVVVDEVGAEEEEEARSLEINQVEVVSNWFL